MKSQDTTGKTLGLRIGIVRNERKMSQAALGEAIGVQRGTVTNWECGIREIKAENIVKIARALSVSTDFLLGLSEFPSEKAVLDHQLTQLGFSQAAIRKLELESIFSKKYPHILSVLIEHDLFSRMMEALSIYINRNEYLEGLSDMLESQLSHLDISMQTEEFSKEFSEHLHDRIVKNIVEDYFWKIYNEYRKLGGDSHATEGNS